MWGKTRKIICENCKNEIPNDSKFCIFCGSIVKRELKKPVNRRKLNISIVSTLTALFLFSMAALTYFINQKVELENYISNLEIINNNYKEEILNLENENELLSKNVDEVKKKLLNKEEELNKIYQNLKNIPLGKITFSLYGSEKDLETKYITNILGEQIGYVSVEKWKGLGIDYYTVVLLKIHIQGDDTSGAKDLILVSTSDLISTDTGENFISYLKKEYKDTIIEVPKNNSNYIINKENYSFNIEINNLKIRDWWFDSMVIQIY